MLGVGDGSAVYLALHPVDFRRGIAALSSYAREHLGVAPDSGVVLVFRSRRPGRVKVLFHDGSGMVLVAKWPDRCEVVRIGVRSAGRRCRRVFCGFRE